MSTGRARGERRPARNRLGRVWLTGAAGRRLVQPHGIADPSSHKKAPGPSSHKKAPGPSSHKKAPGPSSRQGGNERGRVVPASEARGKQRVERSEVSPASASPDEVSANEVNGSQRVLREERAKASEARSVSPGAARTGAKRRAGTSRRASTARASNASEEERAQKPGRERPGFWHPAGSSILRDSEARPPSAPGAFKRCCCLCCLASDPGAFRAVLEAIDSETPN